MSRLEESLDLLTRLNEARRLKHHELAEALVIELDEHDARCGYSRPIRVEDQVEQPGKRYGRNARAVRK